MTGSLTPLRSKEEVHDYRYFPEPDLVPVAPTEEMLERARAALPELPAARLERYRADYGLADDVAGTLVGWSELGRFFEESAGRRRTANAGRDRALDDRRAGRAACASRASRTRVESKLSPDALAELVGMVEGRTLSQSAPRRRCSAELTAEGGDPQAIVEARGLAPIADTGELEAIVERAIEANPAAVEQIRGGKAQAAGAIVGAVMKETKGRADGAEVNRLIREKLGAVSDRQPDRSGCVVAVAALRSWRSGSRSRSSASC